MPLSVESVSLNPSSGEPDPRKVGMPLSWLTPAPVSATHGCNFEMSSARRSAPSLVDLAEVSVLSGYWRFETDGFLVVDDATDGLHRLRLRGVRVRTATSRRSGRTA